MGLLRSWVNPPGVEGLVRTIGLYLGTNIKTGRGVAVDAKLLDTHVHIMGPPGVGKSRLELWMFQLLCRIPKASVFVFNPKGDLARQCRDWAMGHGLTKRLTWFDPADEQHVLGWNPLRPNGLLPATHAKAAREGLLAAWGQTQIDQTPQLARFLLLALFVARELTLTIVEALRLLLPGTGLRQALLPRIQDPYVQEALMYLDSLRAQRQDELTASAVARLEAFVMDPLIRRVLTQQEHAVDFGQVIADNGVFISNTELYRPLRSNDVRLLNRLMINDLLSHVFNRPSGRRTPVFCIIDEVHMVATEDLCVALELGREVGFHCVIAHQHPSQLRGEDGQSLLYDSVMNCARTKVVFGGLSVENMEPITRELVHDQYDPWFVKDQITGLEVEPMDSWTMQVARTENWTTSNGRTTGTSATGTDGLSHAWSRQDGVAESEGESESSGTSSSVQTMAGVGETVLPSGEVVASTNQLTGGGEGTFSGSARSHSRTVSTVHGATETRSSSQARGSHEANSEQQSRGGSETRTLVPITHHKKRRVVTHRTFLPQEEFMALKLQEIQELPQAHFVLKVPHNSAVILRGPCVETPKLSERRRRECMARVYAQACYSTPEKIDAEERARHARLQAEAAPRILASRSRGNLKQRKEPINASRPVLAPEPTSASISPVAHQVPDVVARYADLGLPDPENLKSARDEALEMYGIKRWKASLFNSRNVLEGVFCNVAEAHSKATGQYLRRNPSPKAVRDYLHQHGLLDADAWSMCVQAYSGESAHVHHRGKPTPENALFWLNQSEILSHFVLQRFEAWSAPA